jgi:hypothetical protein
MYVHDVWWMAGANWLTQGACFALICRILSDRQWRWRDWLIVFLGPLAGAAGFWMECK